VQNKIEISLSDTSAPSLVVNGVDISGWVKPDFRLVEVEHEDGYRLAELTVTIPVVMP
jgi:hypothetical protein